MVRCDIYGPPAWLSLSAVTEQITVDNPGQLSQFDWRGIVLAESTEGMLITKDKRMKARAEDRDIQTRWSAGFLKETFESCGISRSQYRSNLDDYIADAFVPADVATVLRDAEKS